MWVKRLLLAVPVDLWLCSCSGLDEQLGSRSRVLQPWGHQSALMGTPVQRGESKRTQKALMQEFSPRGMDQINTEIN